MHSSFIDNIWEADLADIQLISKFDKGFRFLWFSIDMLTWVICLKEGKGFTITNSFQKVLDESNRRPIKIWVDKCSKFYDRSMKFWLEKKAIEMNLTHHDRFHSKIF